MRKKLRDFSREAFALCVVDEMYIEVPLFL